MDPDTAARAAKIRAWHARLPDRWRAPLEGHLDPDLIAALVAHIDALPEFPTIEVEPVSPGLPTGIGWSREDDSEEGEGEPDVVRTDSEVLTYGQNSFTFRPSAHGLERLREWAREALPIVRDARTALRAILESPLVPADPAELGKATPAEDGLWKTQQKLDRALRLIGHALLDEDTAEPERRELAELLLEISDLQIAVPRRLPATILQRMLERAGRLHRAPLLVGLLPYTDEVRLRGATRRPRVDLEGEFTAAIRGEVSRAILAAIFSLGEENGPWWSEVVANSDWGRLLGDHPDPFDPIELIDRYFEIADLCGDRLARGEDLPFPPPVWLQEVLSVWPEDATLGLLVPALPDWPGWEARGDESIQSAARTLARIPHAMGTLFSAVPAMIAQQLVERIHSAEARAGDLTLSAACACVLHERRVGVFPRTWDDVVASGALAEVPIDPCSSAGAPLTLDPELRIVRSVGNDGSAGPLPPPLESLDGEWFLPDGTPVDAESGISTDDIVIEIPPLR